ncbi:MAG: helix-turn-helix transcriptional regulator [Bacteroides sp.]|nr:helix-turn-helix transcriptional regulator [Eubacterium sp.]MCM1419082.1 helix-turn-helix transcriptional regulator [Roseburia sp.]MCM1462944.1 helix-turn-helix transcriptional regulator [Bacteroides sp.]
MKIMIDKQIALFRKRAGLTQEQLAEKLGVSGQAVSKWESAQCCPDIALLPDLAACFHVSVDELLGVYAEKNDDRSRLAEHMIEMSLLSWKCGLLSLVEYAEKVTEFPFLKTAVNIIVTEDHNAETSEEILRAAAGDDPVKRLVSDCVSVLDKGVTTASMIQILESRLSHREMVCLKIKRPDLFLI